MSYPPMISRNTAGGLLALAVSALLATSTSAAVAVNTVALTGTDGVLGPNLGPGVTFYDFTGSSNLDPSTIGPAGEVYFHGYVEGAGYDVSNDGGIWTNAGGSLNTIVREGPDGTDTGLSDGAYFVSSQSAGSGQFHAPHVKANGKYLVAATVGGPGRGLYNNNGIWTNLSGTMQALFLEGTDGPLGPNLGPGVNFWGTPSVVLNDVGEAVVRGFLTGTGIGNDNNSAIWKLTGGQMTLIAREGPEGPGPGRNPNQQVYFKDLPTPSLNNAGQFAYMGSFYGPGIHSANDSGIWMTINDTLTIMVLEGRDNQYGPNLGPGVKFGTLTNNPILNDAGTLMFDANLAGLNGAQGSGRGIWTISAGVTSALVMNETDGPLGPGLGPGVQFDRFYNNLLNANDDIVFKAKLIGSGINASNEWSIWKKAGGTLELLAREGPTGPGPNVGAGVYFTSMDAPVLNASGDIAFLGFLTGDGVGNSNNSGLWATSNGVLVNIVREGDAFDVDPTTDQDLRIISRINFPADSNGGQSDIFTSGTGAGLMTFRLEFTDGSKGIFTAQVPEPSTFFLLLAGAACGVLRSR